MKQEVVGTMAGGNGHVSVEKGLKFQRYFTGKGVSPYDAVEWERRTASIVNESGGVIFEQHDVEVPKNWSQTATNIVASKYFHGTVGSPEREGSVRQLISRVVDTMIGWGTNGKYFASPEDGTTFHDELAHLLVNQMVAFNSPVWFNCGVDEKPQCSACFINSVEDTMGSILGLAKTEAMLFKFGSGTGSNLSPIRSSIEQLSGGGIASGPVSFMKGFDAFAGVIKSGGKTRRAAKMVILNADHPDIVEFINSKANEEKKAWVLLEEGYGGGVDGEAYSSIFFQNANHSVRVTDKFMEAVANDGKWSTHSITTGEPVKTYQARELMDMISESSHICGDPGMQYDSTINRWHTCKSTAPINASNPCSEYMFLDDSACNLASLNLMKFLKEGGGFDAEAFAAGVRTIITAQEIMVDNAGYPTESIKRNSHAYRPLGLGYANLGALLMSRGTPYDSDEGRDWAGSLTALMTGEAYAQSARIARDHGGPFSGHAANREPFMRVMGKHRAALQGINTDHVPETLFAAASQSWDDAIELGEKFGYRNAQATVLAPTGTIGFMMDCDTTGVEPDIALVKYKKLVGGGLMKIVNNTVPMALRRLGYEKAQVDAIVVYIDEHETIEGAPHLDPKHLPVFDCAFKPARGSRSIHYMGHIKMLGATQPFISGAISKTINVPTDAAVEDIEQAYIDSWRLGTKAVSIYRDGSKRTQPLNTMRASHTTPTLTPAAPQPVRHRLPDERKAITHKFDIAGHEGYITAGLYETGAPGEIFLVMAKEGSTISGFADAFAQAVSYALQYGVPLQVLVDKFSHVRFEPAGITKNQNIRVAKSIVDYVFRWMATKFLSPEAQYRAGVNVKIEAEPEGEQLELASLETDTDRAPEVRSTGEQGASFAIQNDQDAPPCSTCGAIMIRNGSCYKCGNCGATSGCA